jgi:redox-sensitive bicupin YhaK (pirin superfamily)
VTLAVDEAAELALYVLDGPLAGDGSPVAVGELAVLTPGSHVTLAATKTQPATVALIGGQPAEGPILFAGPFVMDTPERLAQAKQDYLAGRMGRLEGVPF